MDGAFRFAQSPPLGHWFSGTSFSRFLQPAGELHRRDRAAVADPVAVLRAGPCLSRRSRKYENKGSEFGDDADFTPYYGPGVIAIDACTAHSGMVNCLVIDD